MPITARRSNGQAASAYGERDLYDLVAAVCRYVSPERPETVSQRAFDRSRAGAGHPDAPSARAIGMRLGDGERSMPWDLLRRRALAANLDVDRSHGRHRGQAADPELDIRHVIFALRWTTREAGLPTIAPDRYRAVRRELLAAERRRHRRHHDHDRLLPILLPSVGQVTRITRDHDHDQRRRAAVAEEQAVITGLVVEGGAPAQGAGDAEPDEPAASDARQMSLIETSEEAKSLALWDRALEFAGLPPRSALQPLREESRKRRRASQAPETRAMPLEVAIHHYVEANGAMPSRDSLHKFAAMADIAVAALTKSWIEHLDDARDYRKGLGLSSPAEDPKPLGRGRRLEIKVPEGGIPGAPPRRKGRSRYSEQDCINDLRRFNDELAPGEPRTRDRYVAFASEHGLMSASRFEAYGGFRRLLRKARRC
jgi:hypothetical protein